MLSRPASHIVNDCLIMIFIICEPSGPFFWAGSTYTLYPSSYYYSSGQIATFILTLAWGMAVSFLSPSWWVQTCRSRSWCETRCRPGYEADWSSSVDCSSSAGEGMNKYSYSLWPKCVEKINTKAWLWPAWNFLGVQGCFHFAKGNTIVKLFKEHQAKTKFSLKQRNPCLVKSDYRPRLHSIVMLSEQQLNTSHKQCIWHDILVSNMCKISELFSWLSNFFAEAALWNWPQGNRVHDLCGFP